MEDVIFWIIIGLIFFSLFAIYIVPATIDWWVIRGIEQMQKEIEEALEDDNV